MTLFTLFLVLHNVDEPGAFVSHFLPYVGLLSILCGLTVLVKTTRILVLEYLFLGHMTVGVPLLLINIFTLVLSIILGGWVATEIFAVKLAPLLATSAIFSVVLGLALQDTLGNLFAGVALQFDKPYELGDWIEIQSTGQKWVGQVQEISWRATNLLGLSDESITIPNRVLAAAQVSNFSTRFRPIVRSQVFRIPFGSPNDKVKEMLILAAAKVPAIRRNPAPLVLITETTESWATFKLIYFIDDYGSQFSIADKIISNSLEALEQSGVPLASTRLLLMRPESAA